MTGNDFQIFSATDTNRLHAGLKSEAFRELCQGGAISSNNIFTAPASHTFPSRRARIAPEYSPELPR